MDKTSDDVISIQTEEISDGNTKISCPNCSQSLRIPESYDGSVRCPSCKTVFQAKDGKPLNPVYQVEEIEGLRDDYWYSKYCNLLIAMCFLGGLSAYIGHVIAPECSDADTAFEKLGILAFQISWLGFVACPIIWIISLFNGEVDSYRILARVLVTGIVMVFSSAIFMDFILQDMWCGCWGICGIGTGWGG